MKVGIISDTHNNFENTKWALRTLSERRITRLFHCGDITAPIMMDLFEPFDAHFVLGNMDRERAALRAQAGGQAIPFSFTTELAGKNIAIVHGHFSEELNALINGGEYDYIFHGHTHMRRDERIGPSRVINPGALGGSKKQSRSFCIVDLQKDEVTFIEK
jgi:hypothetical protein